MTIKLVKKQDEKSEPQPAKQKPSQSQVITTAQAWVEEFKARKSRPNLAALFGQGSRASA